MNNMNGIISEVQQIFNQKLNLEDTKEGANEAVFFYLNAKARIAQDKAKKDSLESKKGSSKIVTGEELRRFFDRNSGMSHPLEETHGQEKISDSSTRDEREI